MTGAHPRLPPYLPEPQPGPAVPEQAPRALEARGAAATATGGEKDLSYAQGSFFLSPVPAELAAREDPTVRAMPKRMHEEKSQDLFPGRGLMGVSPLSPPPPHALFGALIASLSCRSTCRQ